MFTGGVDILPEGGNGYSKFFTIRSHDPSGSHFSPLGPLGAASASLSCRVFCAIATRFAASNDGLIL